mgnify:CR=1 FL=1
MFIYPTTICGCDSNISIFEWLDFGPIDPEFFFRRRCFVLKRIYFSFQLNGWLIVCLFYRFVFFCNISPGRLLVCVFKHLSWWRWWWWWINFRFFPLLNIYLASILLLLLSSFVFLCLFCLVCLFVGSIINCCCCCILSQKKKFSVIKCVNKLSISKKICVTCMLLWYTRWHTYFFFFFLI